MRINANYFTQKTSGLLTQGASTIYPSFFDLGTDLSFLPWINYNEDKRTGFDFSLSANKKIGDFDVTLGVNGMVFSSKASIRDEVANESYLLRQGRALDATYGYVCEGFFQDQADIEKHAKQTFGTVRPGDLKYKDINGDGVIDSNDRYPIGFHNVPEMFYSFKLGFSYKRLDFSCLFQGAGNVTYNFQNSNIPFNNEGSTPITEWLDRWTPENRGASLPRISYTRPGNNNYQHSTFWQKNGNYLRLKNVEIGYKIPERWIGVIGAENARLYVNGTNLLTWDNVPVYDPENTETKYPLMRIINFGVKVTF